jgi:hypothetical protein
VLSATWTSNAAVPPTLNREYLVEK